MFNKFHYIKNFGKLGFCVCPSNFPAVVEIKIFVKSNHYFSHNGIIHNKGFAYNVCKDNPIILKSNGKHIFLDETTAQDEKIRWGKCFTTKGGSGKTYEDMDKAVTEVINFFSKQ
jgi:hypothetical protein